MPKVRLSRIGVPDGSVFLLVCQCPARRASQVVRWCRARNHGIGEICQKVSNVFHALEQYLVDVYWQCSWHGGPSFPWPVPSHCTRREKSLPPVTWRRYFDVLLFRPQIGHLPVRESLFVIGVRLVLWYLDVLSCFAPISIKLTSLSHQLVRESLFVIGDAAGALNSVSDVLSLWRSRTLQIFFSNGMIYVLF